MMLAFNMCYMTKNFENLCSLIHVLFILVPGRVAQLVTCLAADICLTADPVVASSTPTWSHTFVKLIMK